MEQPSTANRQKRVHRSLENFDEYNINPPLLTSPRSLEACRQHGIEAEELVYRYEDSFFEKNITEDIQEIRYRHYEKKRLEKLAIVRDERQRLVNSGWVPTAPNSSRDRDARSEANSTFDEERKSTAALKEQRAMESIKARRQQELEQMVAYELKLNQVAQEQQRQLEIEKQKEQQRQREAQARQKVWEEMQRQKEIDKAKKEAKQERLRKKLAAEEFAAEQARKEQEEAEEKERMREARERELEARRLREEHKRQTEMLIEQQQKQVELRRIEMQEKDERRKAEMEARQLEMMVKAEEERTRAQQRIRGALEQQKDLLKQQRQLFHERQEKNAIKRQQYEAQQRADIERRKLAAKHKNEELKRAFERMEHIASKKRRETLSKERKAEENLQRVQEEREREHRQKMERQRLKQADKLEAVERLQRIEDYKREQALEKLRLDDERTSALQNFNEQMLEERKAFRRQNDLERARLLESIEKMKKNPAKALASSGPLSVRPGSARNQGVKSGSA